MSGDHTESMGDELACRRPLQSGGRAAVAFAGIREGLHPDRALLRDALKTQEPARAQAFVAALGGCPCARAGCLEHLDPGPPLPGLTSAPLSPPSPGAAGVHLTLLFTSGARDEPADDLLRRLRAEGRAGPLLHVGGDAGGPALILDVSPDDAVEMLDRIRVGALAGGAIVLGVARAAPPGEAQGARDLIRAALTGSPQHQADLYARLLPAVEFAVFRVLGPSRPPEQHAEARQEAMIALFGALERFRGEGDLEGFAYRIGANRAKRYLDGAASIDGLGADPLATHAAFYAGGGEDAETRAQAREELDEIMRVYERILSPGEADVLRMEFLEGLSAEEVAAQTGRTREHIRVLRHEMRTKLTLFCQRFLHKRTIPEIARALAMDVTTVQKMLRAIRCAVGP